MYTLYRAPRIVYLYRQAYLFIIRSILINRNACSLHNCKALRFSSTGKLSIYCLALALNMSN